MTAVTSIEVAPLEVSVTVTGTFDSARNGSEMPTLSALACAGWPSATSTSLSASSSLWTLVLTIAAEA